MKLLKQTLILLASLASLEAQTAQPVKNITTVIQATPIEKKVTKAENQNLKKKEAIKTTSKKAPEVKKEKAIVKIVKKEIIVTNKPEKIQEIKKIEAPLKNTPENTQEIKKNEVAVKEAQIIILKKKEPKKLPLIAQDRTYCEMILNYKICENFTNTYTKKIESKYGLSYVYNKSKSDFSYRNYKTTFPAIDYDIRFWFNPFIGFYVNYFYTIAGHITWIVPKKQTSKILSPFLVKQIRSGAIFRTPLNSKHGSTATFGLGYNLRKEVADKSQDHLSLSSDGFDMFLEFQINSRSRYQTIFGLELAYDFKYIEESEDDIKSGKKVDIYKMEAYLGGRLEIDKVNKLFWRFILDSHNLSYKGYTSVRDPILSKKLNNTTITNNYYIFQLGYAIAN